MTIPKDNTQLENARRLRREMTPHERKLWYLFLRKYPVKIYKQRIIGRFIVDFYCASARKAARPSHSPAVTDLPKGEPRGCTLYTVCWHEKWSVSVSIRSIGCFMSILAAAAGHFPSRSQNHFRLFKNICAFVHLEYINALYFIITNKSEAQSQAP